jgi:hypothetical protein
LNGGRGPWLPIYQRRMLAMYEHPDLTHFAKVFLGWMLVVLQPGRNRLEDVTIDTIAETLHAHRTTVNAALTLCHELGFINYEFQRGHPGWVELLAHQELLAATGWVLAERGKAQVAPRKRTGALRTKSAERTGKTLEALYDSLQRGVDTARATAEPLSAGEGSSEGTGVAGAPHVVDAAGLDERSSRVTVEYAEPTSGYELTDDGELIEHRDVDIDALVIEIAEYDTIDHRLDPLEEPDTGDPVEAAIRRLRDEFGDVAEVVA